MEGLVWFLGGEDLLVVKGQATHSSILGLPCGLAGKETTCKRETWVQSLGWEEPLEKGKATYSSILAWRIPWTVQSMGSQSRTWLSDFNFHFREWLNKLWWIEKKYFIDLGNYRLLCNPSNKYHHNWDLDLFYPLACFGEHALANQPIRCSLLHPKSQPIKNEVGPMCFSMPANQQKSH